MMVNSWLIAGATFVSAFGSAVVALLVARRLPDRHFNADARDVIKLGMGLIATLAALVLGLLVATAKGTFDAETNATRQIAADFLMLDRLLATYGPETDAARAKLRHSLEVALSVLWPEEGSESRKLRPDAVHGDMQAFYEDIARLTPADDAGHDLKERTLQTTGDLAKTWFRMFVERGSTLPVPLVATLIFWLMVLFAGYGLLAPPNPTVITILLISAISVAGAMFLVAELSQPFSGHIRVSPEPFQDALTHLRR
jgi:hypothetical protein